jgi:uracil phosphoribosyltransferase
VKRRFGIVVDDVATPMRGRAQPDRAAVESLARLRIVQNPLSLTLLARVRDRRTDIFQFGALSTQLASLLLWEACNDVALAETQVPNFAGTAITVHQLAERVAGVAILRAGLLFATPFRGIMPDAPLHQIGIRRDERSLRAIVYGDNLPADPDWADRVLILDPMLATGGSAVAALKHIRRSHAGRIVIVSLIAAPVGVETVLNADPDVRIISAALDDRLDDRGFIEPGLGDAGDRLFGTLPG